MDKRIFELKIFYSETDKKKMIQDEKV